MSNWLEKDPADYFTLSPNTIASSVEDGLQLDFPNKPTKVEINRSNITRLNRYYGKSQAKHLRSLLGFYDPDFHTCFIHPNQSSLIPEIHENIHGLAYSKNPFYIDPYSNNVDVDPIEMKVVLHTFNEGLADWGSLVVSKYLGDSTYPDVFSCELPEETMDEFRMYQNSLNTYIKALRLLSTESNLETLLDTSFYVEEFIRLSTRVGYYSIHQAMYLLRSNQMPLGQAFENLIMNPPLTLNALTNLGKS